MPEESPPTGWWGRLWQTPGRWWTLGLPLGGVLMFVVGMLFLTGFVASVELSSTETFCVSCHEMREFVYQEYLQSSHNQNPSGVRATCPDCHVPHPWGPKLMRKVGATFKELPNHFLGKIDTKEKFEARRLEMAEWVWDAMKKSDSRECRNCHSLGGMDLAAQDPRAARKHAPERLQKSGETCIDCHQGIVHALPDITSAAAD